MKEVAAVIDEGIRKAVEDMPDEEQLIELAELFKMFGDSTRISILWALSVTELCVGDIANVLSMSSTAISHQLRLLKNARLVRSRREGKVIYYALADEHVLTIFAQGMSHIEE